MPRLDLLFLLCFLFFQLSTSARSAEVDPDWQRWCGTRDGNMAATATGLPTTPEVGNAAWSVELGSLTYGTPIVADGKVYVGYMPRRGRSRPRVRGAVLLCLDAASGEEHWRLQHRWALSRMHISLRTGSGREVDLAWGSYGWCGSLAAADGRLYGVSPLCDVLALDPAGLADGNDGDFDREASYVAQPERVRILPGAGDRALDGELRPGEPLVAIDWNEDAADPGDGADVLWRYDLVNELACWFEDAAGGSPLVHDGRVYALMPIGIKRHVRLSEALPVLVALDAESGALIAHDRVGIGPRVAHGTWSSPSLARGVGGRDLILVGGPDGTCYAFDAAPRDGELVEIWRCDLNSPGHRGLGREDGKVVRSDRHGEIIATPVVHDGRVYCATGRDPGHRGIGPGRLVCIDASLEGDLTDRGELWVFDDIRRSTSTVAVADGRVYAADIAPGTVYCLDADDGGERWRRVVVSDPRDDRRADDQGIWGSPLLADGRILVGNGKGELWILDADDGAVLHVADLGGAIHTTPVPAGGRLYVATHRRLYCFGGGE